MCRKLHQIDAGHLQRPQIIKDFSKVCFSQFWLLFWMLIELQSKDTWKYDPKSNVPSWLEESHFQLMKGMSKSVTKTWGEKWPNWGEMSKSMTFDEIYLGQYWGGQNRWEIWYVDLRCGTPLTATQVGTTQKYPRSDSHVCHCCLQNHLPPFCHHHQCRHLCQKQFTEYNLKLYIFFFFKYSPS